MKIYSVLLLSSALSINAASDVELGDRRVPVGTPSDCVVIEMPQASVTAAAAPIEGHASDSAIELTVGSAEAVESYDVGAESDLDEPVAARVVSERQQRGRSSARSLERRRTRSLGARQISSREYASLVREPSFRASDYYDRDGYIGQKVQKMILEEARYDARSKAYNVLGTGCMWVAGISGFATTVVSILGGASIIPPIASTVSTACLGSFTTFCIWGAAQFKKSATQYHQASTNIQVRLGLPTNLIVPQVDIRIDPLKNVGVMDTSAPHPPVSAPSARALR
jgi:hypothetical protein